MKICVISTNADEAGAPRHVESIVNGLQADYQFILLFGEQGPVSDRLRSSGHTVHIINEMRTAINPIKDLVALYKLSKLVRRYQPDIIHCHSAKAGMLGRILAFLFGIRWIYTVHGWGWRGLSRFTKSAIILVEKILSKLPRGYYIFVAKDVMNDAFDILKLKALNGMVVYNGVAPFSIPEPSNQSPMVITMPARVSSAKDHKSIISAFEHLNDSNMRLWLCGSGTDAHEFIEFATSLAPKSISQITFLGQRSDMEYIYSRSHVIALISNFEALPLTIIEAMSCSKAVIASNVGGVSELISNDISGILVERGSIEDISQALLKLRDSAYRAKLGNQAKISYSNHFTHKAMLSSVSETYQLLGHAQNDVSK